jgi:hypothetical protein
LLLLEFIGLFFNICTEETLHAIDMHMTSVGFCHQSLSHKLACSFFFIDLIKQWSVSVGIILLQETLSSDLNEVILVVCIITARLDVASLGELLSEV